MVVIAFNPECFGYRDGEELWQCWSTMSGASDSQSIGDQPIRSPSVSDEILYELGYSISPSTEEDEDAVTLSTKINQPSHSSSITHEDCCNADVKGISKSENSSSFEKANRVVCESHIKRFDDIDFQIGVDSSVVSSYPGHKLKDKKYLRKFKRRRRSKKGVTCSPTKLEAICREMSGLVVSEDDGSALETSPESVRSEEGTLQKKEANRGSYGNHDNLTVNEGSDGAPGGESKNKRDEIDSESEGQHSEDIAVILSENNEKPLMEETMEVVQDSPTESVHEVHPRESHSRMCSETRSQDKVELNVEELIAQGLEETDKAESYDCMVSSCNNENTEVGRQSQEKDEISVEKENDSLSSTRNNSPNNLESSGNSSDKLLSDYKNESLPKEYFYEQFDKNLKEFSVRVRRLSEESIAIYTGNSNTEQKAADQLIQTSPSSSTSDLPKFDDLSTPNEFLSEQQETGVSETEKHLNDKQNTPVFCHENLGLKTFSIRVRRLSGDTIASYMSNASSPSKSQNTQKNIFKSPKSPLKSKSTKCRSTRQASNSGKKTKEYPVRKPKLKARNSQVRETQGSESSRSRRVQNKKEQCEKGDSLRGKRSKSGMLESFSEVNFQHKLNPRNSKAQLMRETRVPKTQTLDFSKTVHDNYDVNLLTQLKNCTVSIRKIDFGTSFTQQAAKQRSSCTSEIFKIPLAPVEHEGRRRSSRNSNRHVNSSSPPLMSCTKVSRTQRKQTRLELETMSEVHIPCNLTRVRLRRGKLEKLDNSSQGELLDTSDKHVHGKDTVSSADSKGKSTRSLRQKKSTMQIHDGGSNNCLNTEKEMEITGTSNVDNCRESLAYSHSSPVKLCSVRVRRLSGDTIASYMSREKIPGLFDNIVKNLTKRSERPILSDAVQKMGEMNSVSDFLIPSVPARKRRKSGETVSSLSKWSTRRQALKTSNTRQTPKRKWIDTDSVDSESTIRPCSVKLSRLDPDSVSHCGHNLKEGEVNMPNHIHNPTLNVNNLDKVMDDELYCLRRFLQVPTLVESKPSILSTTATGNTSTGKLEVPKVKACSVVLKRITKKRNFESVNIKKVIAKQLADNVEFSSGSESVHEEEEDFDINKLLCSLKEGEVKGKEVRPEAVTWTKKAEDKTSGISVEMLETKENERERVDFQGLVDSQTGEIINNLSSLPESNDIELQDNEIGKTTKEFAESSEDEPLFNPTLIKISSTHNDEESVKVKEGSDDECIVVQVTSRKGSDSTEPIQVANVEKNDSEESNENLAVKDVVMEKLLPPRRKPESDIWSDDLPDIEVNDLPDIEVNDPILQASEEDHLKTLSCISVYTDNSSSCQFGEKGHKSVESNRDYFQLANKTKDCSVRLQRIDSSFNS